MRQDLYKSGEHIDRLRLWHGGSAAAATCVHAILSDTLDDAGGLFKAQVWGTQEAIRRTTRNANEKHFRKPQEKEEGPQEEEGR